MHTVESIVSLRYAVMGKGFHTVCVMQLLSVISLLSAERPNTDSPANVDAAKEVRENFDG